jgi:hypothetical protein
MVYLYLDESSIASQKWNSTCVQFRVSRSYFMLIFTKCAIHEQYDINACESLFSIMGMWRCKQVVWSGHPQGGGLYLHCYLRVLPIGIKLRFPYLEGNEGNQHTNDCHYLNKDNCLFTCHCL